MRWNLFLKNKSWTGVRLRQAQPLEKNGCSGIEKNSRCACPSNPFFHVTKPAAPRRSQRIAAAENAPRTQQGIHSGVRWTYFIRDRFKMKFVVKSAREGAYARRFSQGISSEISPRKATKQTPLRSRLE
jgi:hypothetical protein